MGTFQNPHVAVDVDAEGEGEGEQRVSAAASSTSSEPESGGSEIKERRISSVSEDGVDIECGESKIHLAKVERDCRICQLSLDAANPESGVPIDLGCSCKDDLGAAHRQCAEAWFKIKGNKTCEICGSTACNVTGANEADSMEPRTESNDDTSSASAARIQQAETRNFWQGHRFLNFLLACVVVAFVISWLFHFNMPS